ncbi:response regulator transcription factor [Rhodoblastus acidophilus]|uniref:Response regulator transcription factor n=1 Tax=Candidatus Rhodoblastus alkanivorans TaxID=2954117 RepID=A0ABS9Z332_9HYPH|nr:response regulator transcription factor [Candidatus Rhodoblastus alkanivorans]MCI4679944.1 response regulator transcription factor [Candidatus Rhodoblastus alkanivorans]MCI4681481.1 response regulator transcription factor [Candidatus Rhodoblastus alkanivorans]MDI4642529.1 response regulator transcription factor [Rhodoblastus acidophilus]
MSQIRRILIVDDDPLLRLSLAEQLSIHDEFVAVQAADASQALEAIRNDTIDLVIMDVGLPDVDGRDAVRRLRAEGFNKPVIMLTAHDSENDIVSGFDSGANDYVNKPFRFAVLLARIRAHLRQYELSEDATFQIGAYTFSPNTKMLVSENGAKLRLTEKETAILQYLNRAKGCVVSREDLLRDVWGYNSNVTTHTLETHIYRLRQKIENDPASAKLLLTDAGGYRLAI